ncbi:LysR family transcriptional regulator [Pseudoroseicyclus aestuarii]|uniref:LysR family transcriptional regulator n=1 Tax=Pseudoroseicyclus aestuarii TaxID=1795041 RepID=A0A318SVD3_9RHOB|nr:LysR family transcriptional regulator [Pseudoroseicyclus aestuarii]PYE85871.1 LysR family transcriptional regulator [Pseudoroseicyclus aestuarii]
MKDEPRPDDLLLFLALAETGGLARAALATGTSAPTLSRRMAALEAQLGRRLFLRGAQGYALTPDGRALAETAQPLSRTLDRVRDWAMGAAPVRVRITAGFWTSRFLARRIGDVWRPGAGWTPEFLPGNAILDIARRQVDIGVRNRRPEQPWLAGRRTARIGYAVYGKGPEVAGFVGRAEGQPTTPSDRWLAETHPDRIVTTATEGRLMLDLALSGLGRIVLPTFVGEAEPGLVRLSEDIAEIAHDEWIVAHQDARETPPVRRALDAVTRLLTQERVA